MLSHKRMFVVLLGLCLFVSNAVAAPTVKKLGTANANSGSVNAIPARATNDSNASRAASVRSNAVGVKPVTITKKVEDNKIDNVSTSRLTVGKYLHNKGVSSGIIQQADSAPAVQSDDFIELTDRVVQLENKIDTKQEQLSSTNVVTSGNGPIVSSVSADNGTVTVTKTDVTIPVGAVESETRAYIWVQ